jgi:excisionase family DNA binding protein
MIPAVYTPSEVGELLKISEEDVRELVRQGRLTGVDILGRDVRITATALAAFVGNGGNAAAVGPTPGAPPPGPGLSPRTSTPKRRNFELEAAGRRWILEHIRQVAPDLVQHSRKAVEANGKLAIVCLSTTKSGPSRNYWFGFPGHLLTSGREVLLVPVLALEQPLAFVVPYAPHRSFLESLPVSRQTGQVMFFVDEDAGSYSLSGYTGAGSIDLSPYRNAFHLFERNHRGRAA